MWTKLIEWITFKRFRMKRARDRYEFLKQAISSRHFNGYAGLIVDDSLGKKFSKKDFACFKAPMYYWVKNQDGFWCVFWDRGRLTREIGTGAPLKPGEVMIEDTAGRTKPSSTLETIDEQKSLVSSAPIATV